MRTSRASRTAALAAISAATLVTTLAGATSARADDRSSTGRVYEATNAAAGNAVQVFERAADGTLTVGPLVPTGGLGAGVSLGSQGGVIRAGDRLFVVNGGDDTVSSFAITRRGLELRDVEPSGGDLPVSVTVHDDTVYVLNTGSDAITGFRVSERGRLRPIGGSTRPLSGTAVGGAQVNFADDGERLVVTEKATSRIDTYRVGDDGRASGPTVTASAGSTPFGFDVDRAGHVIVSEAASGSLSSYQLKGRTLSVVTAALGDAQAAPCWVVITPNGRFAYTTNAGSGSISSYAIAEDGSLTLLASVAGTTGAGPTDEAISRDGRFLYARVRNGSVAAFAIGADGSLTALGTAAGATAIGSSGLAAS
jgi:DNA-binding beta-propeller fold protein YncE